jgi:hypothetical protein
MTFLIADPFTDSLERLTGDEPRAAKSTATLRMICTRSPL